MERKIIEAIDAEVERLFEDMVSTVQELVRIPSITGSEGSAQEFVRKKYEASGLEVCSFVTDRSKVENHPAFNDSGRAFAERPNIIGIQKGNPKKNSIILNGHVDVVSPEPIDQWTYDPWGGEIKGNYLYGRGALDMKAGLIANLFALKALNQAGIHPEGTVVLQSVIEEEEGGGGGTLACLLEGHTANGMIITEPTPAVTVALSGILRCLIKVKGKSAHAAQSHLGVNAIGKIIPIYQAVEKLDAKRKAEVKFSLIDEKDGPACHINVGTLKCGDWIPTVAGFAEMGCRIGFIPGEKMADIQKLIENTINKTAAKDPWLSEHPPEIEWLPFSAEPYYQDPSHPFVKSVISSIKPILKQNIEVKPRGATWSEDTRFSQYFDFPGLSFGPSGESPHGVDEYVDLDSLRQTTKAIALATLEWCSQNQ
jgi:acetylornithine deacetylase